MIFFQINGRTIASPKDISYSYENLDRIERTINGSMVVDVIGKKRKIDVSWDFLTKEDMITLSSEVSNNVFVAISYKNNITGETTSLSVIPRDFSYSPGYDWVNDKVIWKNIYISFEER